MKIASIHKFLEIQRQARKLVSEQLGIPENMDAFAWAAEKSTTLQSYTENPFAQIFRIHGFGLEIRTEEFYIDFDYSISGRPDGFDAWRLYVFQANSRHDSTAKDDALCKKLFNWVAVLEREGVIHQFDNLYYLI